MASPVKRRRIEAESPPSEGEIQVDTKGVIEAEFEGIAKIEADTMGVFVWCTPGDEVMEISSLERTVSSVKKAAIYFVEMLMQDEEDLDFYSLVDTELHLLRPGVSHCSLWHGDIGFLADDRKTLESLCIQRGDMLLFEVHEGLDSSASSSSGSRAPPTIDLTSSDTRDADHDG